MQGRVEPGSVETRPSPPLVTLRSSLRMLPIGRNQPTPDDRRSPTVPPPCDQAAFQEAAVVHVCPTGLPRALRALAHEAGYPRTGPPSDEPGAVTASCDQSSCSPAVPHMCHKQRSPAVSSGQSRSLTEDRWTGRRSLTWVGRSPKLHGMQGVMEDRVTSLLALDQPVLFRTSAVDSVVHARTRGCLVVVVIRWCRRPTGTDPVGRLVRVAIVWRSRRWGRGGRLGTASCGLGRGCRPRRSTGGGRR